MVASSDVIYLAGGMRSGWQDQMPDGLCYIDPRTHGLTDPVRYTAWDLAGVARCDMLFGYMEADNPSLYGLALEVGFAKALGKLIVIVDEIFADDPRSRYLEMIRQCADVRVPTLQDGIKEAESYKRRERGGYGVKSCQY